MLSEIELSEFVNYNWPLFAILFWKKKLGATCTGNYGVL